MHANLVSGLSATAITIIVEYYYPARVILLCPIPSHIFDIN
jgi:hypothetical protein